MKGGDNWLLKRFCSMKLETPYKAGLLSLQNGASPVCVTSKNRCIGLVTKCFINCQVYSALMEITKMYAY
jgi:hypothetical protein